MDGRTLINGLRYKKEVVPIWMHASGVNYRSGGWITKLSLFYRGFNFADCLWCLERTLEKESRVNPLFHHHDSNLWLIILCYAAARLKNLRDLVLNLCETLLVATQAQGIAYGPLHPTCRLQHHLCTQ